MRLLGVDVNMTSDGRLIELGTGQVLAVEAIDTASKMIRAVPAGADGPQLVLV